MASCGTHLSYDSGCRSCHVVDELTAKQQEHEEHFRRVLREAEQGERDLEYYVDELKCLKLVECSKHSFTDGRCPECYHAELSRKAQDVHEDQVRRLRRALEERESRAEKLLKTVVMGTALEEGIRRSVSSSKSGSKKGGKKDDDTKMLLIGGSVVALALGALWALWKVLSFVAPVLLPAGVAGVVLWQLHKAGKLPWPGSKGDG